MELLREMLVFLLCFTYFLFSDFNYRYSRSITISLTAFFTLS